MWDRVSHLYKATGRIIIQYISTGIFLAVKGEDNILDRMVADIPRMRSALINTFLHAIWHCLAEVVVNERRGLLGSRIAQKAFGKQLQLLHSYRVVGFVRVCRTYSRGEAVSLLWRCAYLFSTPAPNSSCESWNSPVRTASFSVTVSLMSSTNCHNVLRSSICYVIGNLYGYA
jgi:hypothetical protein